MKDRVSTNPGRVLITPEDGSSAFYAVLSMADEPAVPGDPLNKATLLKDETAALFGLGSDAVPDDMWERVSLPVGGILFFPRSTPPNQFLVCDGSYVEQENYPVLYSVIGTMFGVSGTQFRIPDLRNAFLRGISNGKTPTTNLGITYNATTIPFIYYQSNGYTYVPGASATNADAVTTDSSGRTLTEGTYSGNSYRAAVRPYNMGLLPCIKY